MYGATIALIIINIKTALEKENERKMNQILINIGQDFRKINILFDEIPCFKSFLPIIFTITAVCIGFVVDVVQAPRKISINYWICLYIPGFTVILFMQYYILIVAKCSEVFVTINKYLGSYLDDGMTCQTMLDLRSQDKVPIGLLDNVPFENLNILDKVSKTYSVNILLIYIALHIM